MTSTDGMTLLYQVPPQLNPQLPATPSFNDSNNGVGEEWTKLVLHVKQFSKAKFSSNLTKDSFLPRMMWVNKSWTIKDLHVKVFSFIRHLIAEWIDWKSPSTKKEPKEKSKYDLRKDLPDVPYKPAGWDDNSFTREDFEKLSDFDAFAMCFPSIASNSYEPHGDEFELHE